MTRRIRTTPAEKAPKSFAERGGPRLAWLVVLLFITTSAGPVAAQSAAAPSLRTAARADSSQPAGRSSDAWFGADKYSHMTVSAFLTAGQLFFYQEKAAFSENRSLTVAISATAAIGLAKEICDGVSHKGTPSLKDVLADFAGIGLAVLIFKVK